MNTFFSIIIPVYNVEPYLRECLDSVLAQTFTDWEAICVDDGSTDGSGAILDEYAARDPRFRIIHQPNAGVSAARNRGLDEAKGEWICFLDADDLWNISLLNTISEMIKKNPDCKLFRFSYEQFDGEYWQGKDRVFVDRDFKSIDISHEISMHDFIFFFFWCYVYRSDILYGIRFPKYIRGEDRCVLNRVQLEKVDLIVATDAVFYGYRKRAGSAMNSMPSYQVLLDEMDHRIDLIEMIDASGKFVDYGRADWAASYFLSFPRIIRYRHDAALLRREWVLRIRKLSNARMLSRQDRKSLQLRCSRLTGWWWSMVEKICLMFLVPARKIYRAIMRHGEC